MNKLTPEERKRITAMQISKDVYPSRPGTVHIKAVGLELAIKKYAAQEIAEITEDRDWHKDQFEMLKRSYESSIATISEKDEQLEKAINIIKLYQREGKKRFSH